MHQAAEQVAEVQVGLALLGALRRGFQRMACRAGIEKGATPGFQRLIADAVEAAAEQHAFGHPRCGAAGLLAGSTATLAYCLHCPEMQVPFWGAWYLLGMLVPTLVGALAGPRLLRW